MTLKTASDGALAGLKFAAAHAAIPRARHEATKVW